MSQHGCPERLSNRTKGFQEEGGSEPTMEVLVETLTGTAFEMTVSPSDTIFAIKSKIFRVEGIPVAQQHLLYNLKELEDSSCLSEHSISDGARLRLVLGMRGGPISTRRLPQPAPSAAEFWPNRIERLLDSNRDEGEWSGGGSGSGCKVTVLVFRDGERVNMLRVKENHDGTYSPIDHNKYSSRVCSRGSSTHAAGGTTSGATSGAGEAARADNAVTAAKMSDLRRRMETLSLLRHNRRGREPDMQKTRSEETLSSSILDEEYKHKFTYEEDNFTPLLDGNYTRYEYDCSFADRYTLLPPIGTRTDSEQSVQDSDDLSDTLAGSILVKGRRDTDEGGAILEECIDREQCRVRRDTSTLAAALAPIPAADYGAVVGSGVGWRREASHSHSASSLRIAGGGAASGGGALAPAYSASTSDLRHAHRLLPSLSRHRNTDHLHLSDERPTITPPAPTTTTSSTPKSRAKRERCCACRKRLGAATLLRCACGAACCAQHRYPDQHACTRANITRLPDI